MKLGPRPGWYVAKTLSYPPPARFHFRSECWPVTTRGTQTLRFGMGLLSRLLQWYDLLANHSIICTLHLRSRSSGEYWIGTTSCEQNAALAYLQFIDIFLAGDPPIWQYSLPCLLIAGTVYVQYLYTMITVGPLIIESPWAKNGVPTGALTALNDLFLVQTFFWKNSWDSVDTTHHPCCLLICWDLLIVR